jgi:3-oxoacyl-(acyl-carrier-protein) synthase
MSGAVVITGIGPVCRAALSAEELSGGVAHGEDWYDPTKYLGPRGFKYFTPATRYVLSAAEVALKDAGLAEGEMPYPTDRRGVFVGTNFGVHEVLRELDDAVLAEGSDGISPANAPNFSLNVCASYVSIKRPLHAFNVTLSSAVVAGLEAIIGSKRSSRARARSGWGAPIW